MKNRPSEIVSEPGERNTASWSGDPDSRQAARSSWELLGRLKAAPMKPIYVGSIYCILCCHLLVFYLLTLESAKVLSVLDTFSVG